MVINTLSMDVVSSSTIVLSSYIETMLKPLLSGAFFMERVGEKKFVMPAM
jgi:hypothetical protein